MKTKIILADDHNLVRMGVAALLKDCPDITIVGEAEDGIEAFSLVRKLAPDIIIIDIGMPKLNGIDAIEAIVAHNPEINAIALSIHKEERYVCGAIQAGAKGYLPKDCFIDELLLAIRTVNRGYYYLSPQVADTVINRFKGGMFLSDKDRPASQLSSRERELLQLLAEGRNTAAIAECLNISIKTVESHRRNIKEKLGLRHQVDLIKFALREGVVQFENWITLSKSRG